MHLPETAFRAELRVLFPRTVEGMVECGRCNGWCGKVHLRIDDGAGARRDSRNSKSRRVKCYQSGLAWFCTRPPLHSAFSLAD